MKTEIIISGGGVPGLCLAALLAQLEIPVLVIDPAGPPDASARPTGRTAAIMRHNLDILLQAGVTEQQLATHGHPLAAMRLIEPEGRAAGHDQVFRASDIDQTAFGLNLPNQALHIALWDICKASPYITLHVGATITVLKHGTAYITATLTSGEDMTAQLVIGADGRNSVVRHLSGITAQEKQYPEAVLTCLLSHTLPHHDTSTEIHYRGGPFTMVPCQGKTSALVYVDKADKLKATADQDLIPHLQEKSRDILGDLRLKTAPVIWPLMTLRADTLITPRVALVAEAAHVLSPIGAQGLNVSLQDVAALRDVIADGIRLGLSVGDPVILNNYARRRSLDILTRTWGVDLLHSSVASQSAIAHLLRRSGGRVIGGIAPLKRQITKLGLCD